MLTILCIIIILIYLLLIGWFNFGFNKVEDFKLQDLVPKTKFSVVIPFRNEAESVPFLLDSILKLNYNTSYFEFILVDDESTDNTVAVIEKILTKAHHINGGPKIRILKNKRRSNSPKKDAITTAIAVAKYGWILTTDADCILPKYWLDCYDEFIQTHEAIAVAGPVRFTGTSSFFNRFQILDTLSLQGATIGSFGIKRPMLCNGANFAYKKSIYSSVNGFKGNDSIASGDDTFLLEKLIELDKDKVLYLKNKEAIVTTKTSKNNTEFINQRLRWASKTSHYNLWFPKIIGLSVFLANVVVILIIPFVVFNVLALKTGVLLFLIKFSIDLLLIFKTSRFFKQEPVLLSYVFASIIYPFLNTYIVALMPFKSYSWKGRKYNR